MLEAVRTALALAAKPTLSAAKSGLRSSGPGAGRPQPFQCQPEPERTERSCLGGNVSASVRVAILPALDFAVARRPYITEDEGSVIVKLSKLHKPGVVLSARL